MLEFRYRVAKFICRALPPIISQKIRELLIKSEEGIVLNKNFVINSFTGSKFYGNTSDFHAFKFSIHGFFDWRNIIIAEQVLRRFKGGIIEVGANIGTETISFADVANRHNQNLVAFEPLDSNLKVLQNNIKMNRLLNTVIEPCLVSESVGVCNFQVPNIQSSGSGHIAKGNNSGTIELDVTTLDVFCKGIPIALIALDVEGFEYQVLLGARNIIKTQRPVIIAEVNQFYLKNRANMTLNEFHNYFTDNNYKCYYINKLGLKKVDINNFIIKSNKNWVCIPIENLKIAKSISNSLLINGLNPLFSFFYFR